MIGFIESMSLLNALKTSLSLYDATSYLSEALGHNIPSTDLLELAAEGKIPIAYNFDGQMAVYVPNTEEYADIYESFSPDYRKDEKPEEKNRELRGYYRIVVNGKFSNSVKAYCSQIGGRGDISISFVTIQSGALFVMINEKNSWEREWYPDVEKFAFKRDDLDTLVTEIRGSGSGGTKQSDDQLTPKERSSLYKMILGLSLKCYKYQPNIDKLPVADIASDLETHGISLSQDTIRKYLREAIDAHYDSEI